MMARYSGTWLSLPNAFNASFTYDPITHASNLIADWDLDALLDWGRFTNQIFSPPPMTYWNSMVVAATFFSWRGEVTITG